MDRNMFHRVEICFPIENKALIQRAISETIDDYLTDNAQSWLLNSDGSYKKASFNKENEFRVQKHLLDTISSNYQLK